MAHHMVYTEYVPCALKSDVYLVLVSVDVCQVCLSYSTVQVFSFLVNSLAQLFYPLLTVESSSLQLLFLHWLFLPEVLIVCTSRIYGLWCQVCICQLLYYYDRLTFMITKSPSITLLTFCHMFILSDINHSCLHNIFFHILLFSSFLYLKFKMHLLVDSI